MTRSVDELNAQHAEWKRQGLCPSCGKEPDVDNTYCYEHLRKLRMTRREAKQRGFCGCCCIRRPGPGRVTCEVCLQRVSDDSRRRRDARRDKGLCIYCGNPAREGHYLSCGPCVERRRGRH